MSNKIFQPINRVMEAIGLVDEDENQLIDNTEVIDEDTEEIEYEDNSKATSTSKNKNKIVSIKTNSAPRVLIKKPQSLDDCTDIIELVKSRKIVIINMVRVEKATAQRMIDCVCGACSALNGAMNLIEEGIYVVTPDNIEVTSEFKQELNNDNKFFSL